MVGSKDSKVVVWDLKKDQKVAIFEGHKASVHCVSITTSATDLDTQSDLDHLCIASGGADRTARTWDLSTGKKKNKFRHKRSISAVVVANDGIRPILATGGVERVIKLWDVETGVLLRSMDGHLDQINCLCLWEGYEMLIISASSDRTLRVFDILTGECLCVLIGHSDSVLSVSVANRDDPVLVSSSDDLSLCMWSLTDVIHTFFSTDQALLGTRNDTPPHLPPVDYQAPPELDRQVLTKEDRKRIRKEAKRIKRIKAKEKFLNGGQLQEFEELEDDEEDDEEEVEVEGGGSQKEEVVLPPSPTPSVSTATNNTSDANAIQLLTRSFSNKVLPEGGEGRGGAGVLSRVLGMGGGHNRVQPDHTGGGGGGVKLGGHFMGGGGGRSSQIGRAHV